MDDLRRVADLRQPPNWYPEGAPLPAKLSSTQVNSLLLICLALLFLIFCHYITFNLHNVFNEKKFMHNEKHLPNFYTFYLYQLPSNRFLNRRIGTTTELENLPNLIEFVFAQTVYSKYCTVLYTIHSLLFSLIYDRILFLRLGT